MCAWHAHNLSSADAAGIQPGAPSHQRRRAAAEQMRRRRDRMLQRKEATAVPAVAAAVDADGTSAEQAKQRRVTKARASAIVDAALEAGNAILGMIDVRVVTEVDVDDGERTPAAKGSTGSTEDGALGAEESLRVSRAVNSFSNIKLIEHAAVLLVLAWSTLVAWHGSRLGGRSDIGFCSCAFVLHDGCPFLKSIDRSVDLYYQDRDGARYFDF